MDLEFSSLKDLYLRVEPALNAKIVEFKRLNYSNIKKEDIWNYLIITKWRNSSNLMLSDIVNDILDDDYFNDNLNNCVKYAIENKVKEQGEIEEQEEV